MTRIRISTVTAGAVLAVTVVLANPVAAAAAEAPGAVTDTVELSGRLSVPSNLELAVPLAGPWIPRLPLRRTTTYFGLLLAGLRVTTPELDIDSYLTPVGQDVLRIVESECVPEAAARVDEIAIGAMLKRPLDDPALWAAAEAMMRIPTSGYTTPLFVAQGLTDREVPAPLSAKLIAELHASGTDMQVGVYPGDHLEAADQALPDVLVFLHRILGNG
ncbi:hypothetical protein [Nocardia cyriacigeorgica]|uniref:hypothetical protein n=1 Tax=Nocardia cyriacigeorgica TaxID=135487 RepID=UPI00245735F2|nr:hypothetical protein [Nocardia cyriacigeorgica]